MVNPLNYFSFHPVLHNWCNKGRGMCYPVCGMVHIKEPLLLIRNSSQCGGSRFPLSLSEWSFTICLTPYNPNWVVLSSTPSYFILISDRFTLRISGRLTLIVFKGYKYILKIIKGIAAHMVDNFIICTRVCKLKQLPL